MLHPKPAFRQSQGNAGKFLLAARAHSTDILFTETYLQTIAMRANAQYMLSLHSLLA